MTALAPLALGDRVTDVEGVIDYADNAVVIAIDGDAITIKTRTGWTEVWHREALRNDADQAAAAAANAAYRLTDAYRVDQVEAQAAFSQIIVEPNPDPFVGVTEIAQRLGTSTNTVQSWRRRKASFPAAYVELASGPVWRWSDVERWAAIPRPAGRPRRGVA